MAEATQALNLASFTAQELYDLAQRARTLADEKNKAVREEEEAAAQKARKALLQSDKFKKLKAAYKELQKRGDKLANVTGSFQIVVPIAVSFDIDEFNLADLLDQSGDLDPDDCFSFNLQGDLGTLEGVKFTKTQRELLKPQVEQYVNHACGEIWKLAPADALAEFKAFLKDVAKFAKTFDAQDEIELDDLQ